MIKEGPLYGAHSFVFLSVYLIFGYVPLALAMFERVPYGRYDPPQPSPLIIFSLPCEFR